MTEDKRLAIYELQFELADEPVVVITSGKNSPLGLAREFIRHGIKTAHFFAAKIDEQIHILRHGNDNDAAIGKTQDFSEEHRGNEIAAIKRQHEKSGVVCVIIAASSGDDQQEKKAVAGKVKQIDRTIPVIFQATSLSGALDCGAVIKCPPGCDTKTVRFGALHKGERGVILAENLDALTISSNPQIFEKIIAGLTQSRRI